MQDDNPRDRLRRRARNVLKWAFMVAYPVFVLFFMIEQTGSVGKGSLITAIFILLLIYW